MCLGEPMQVVACEDYHAVCVARNGERVHIDVSLVGPQPSGSWLLCFLGAARETIAPERAQAISGALQALEAAQAGETDFSAFFPDLDREPTLPDFLRKPA
jgi:hydrogenase expression/formation protein HypC